MAVEFDCKESGCKAKVAYEPKTVPGSAGALLRKIGKGPAPASIVVYLMCPNGHVHRYEVPAALDD